MFRERVGDMSGITFELQHAEFKSSAESFGKGKGAFGTSCNCSQYF